MEKKIALKSSTKLKSITVSLLVIGVLGYADIVIMKDYGGTIFLLAPLLIGFLPPFIASYATDISRKESYRLSFITLFIALAALLVFAIEGLICIVMASPILALMVWCGSYIAYKMRGKEWMNPRNTTIGILVICLSFMSFDYINEPEDLIPVRTKIIVNAPIAETWNHVVTFHKIDEPTDWIFKTGISYPTDATITGTGVGAIRYCNFSTGSFVEPITTWNEPELLQFDVKEQPIPMNEFNPFWEIHPPHLDGYFQSYKGQFKLTKLDENTTEIEGTTWYKVDIGPHIYWQLWSDFIIHRIHERVLNHIKQESEKNKSSLQTSI